MKSAIIGMVNNVSTSMNHHGGGYASIMVKMIKDSCKQVEFIVNPEPNTWNDYDYLCILEGVNYQENTFNFIGGPQPEHIEKLKSILEYKKPIYCINKIVDFNKFNTRFKLEGNFPIAELKDLAIKYGEKNRKTVIGDSHSLSVWKPGFGLNRTDGKTLFGYLKNADYNDLNLKYDETITYFSNIDLRFHLMRQSDPKQATKDLFSRYIDFSSKLNNNTIVEPLPIEHESRKLPGTGLYNGEKYFGSRLERMELRSIVIDLIRNSGQKYISWPDNWVDVDGIKMFDYMESKQSVHLRPKFYKNINDILS
jgi:hypothetical protein